MCSPSAWERSAKTHEILADGAHRDHFGRQVGLQLPVPTITPGTAVMAEVARALAKAGTHTRRTILFISFSGEDRVSLARLYMERPLVPTTMTKAMINIDHAGVGTDGFRQATGLEKNVALEAGQAAEAPTSWTCSDFSGGDHALKEAGFRLAVVSGGVHPHFHQPTDTADTINPEILQTVARCLPPHLATGECAIEQTRG
jgi:hypothetical protein